jgi:hypothetical protein
LPQTLREGPEEAFHALEGVQNVWPGNGRLRDAVMGREQLHEHAVRGQAEVDFVISILAVINGKILILGRFKGVDFTQIFPTNLIL